MFWGLFFIEEAEEYDMSCLEGFCFILNLVGRKGQRGKSGFSIKRPCSPL